MILYVDGSLFESPAQVLVNTVNTVGVMGKGIAHEFRRLFPGMYEQYRELCEQGRIKVGTLWIYDTPNKRVLCFPTKKHWRNPSHVSYIEAGLRSFARNYTSWGIHSIAFPALGCGNGQLDFMTQVRPLMERYLGRLPIDVFIYPHRDSGAVPEHIRPEEMRQWLRTEPTSLPFSEVWDDLRDLLARQSAYVTTSTQNPFSAQLADDPPSLLIVTRGKNVTIHYETLLSFWQQLRTHGFSMRQIAPGISKHIYYLIPIFAALDYVAPVHVHEEYERLDQNPITGLQILPSAFARPCSACQPVLF